MTRTVSAILIITVFSSITCAKYSGGSGDANAPWLIATAEDMNQIGHNSADWNKHFKMTADINLSAYGGTLFNRIGTDWAHLFSGVFNGNGHTIRGFTYTAENTDYVGIFGAVDTAGIIENVSLVDVNVTGRNFIGGLAGYNGGTINNCGSAGKVASTGSDRQYIGGLAGQNTGDINSCYTTGSVSGGNGSFDIGGLAGENEGSISDCYSTAAVTGGDDSSAIGGLAGENGSGSISNCYAAGSVSGGFDIGGLVGLNDSGSIDNCYFLDSGPNNEIGTPLTDAQMKQQSSFAGWDFVWETANGTNDIWAICGGVSYPKLAWQYVAGDFDNDKNVDFADFGRMGQKWRTADANLYCGGTDLTGDGWVDWKDVKIMCDHWLQGW